jgi:hypothetical protein
LKSPKTFPASLSASAPGVLDSGFPLLLSANCCVTASVQSVVCTGVPGLFGYPDPTLAASFPTDRCGLPAGTVPLRLSTQGSSSRELRSPSKYHRAVTCLSASLRRRSPAPSASRGVLALFATSTRGVHFSKGFRPSYVPPSAFRTLSTVCSSPSLAHLFRCAAVSRVLAPGVSSPDQAAPPFGGLYPRVVGAAACRLPSSSERRVDLRVLLLVVVRSVRRGV